MPIRHYRDLIVWQKSMLLATEVYQVTQRLPSTERFGLVVQIRRCAVSIPANLAEGHERHSRGDFRRFVGVAAGSLAELETQLELSERLHFLTPEEIGAARLLTVEVGRMLSTLIRRLRT